MDKNKYPRQHGLCGVYYRVQRDGQWENICVSDMTKEEIEKVTGNMDKETLARLVQVLASTIHDIGELGHIYSRTVSEGERI